MVRSLITSILLPLATPKPSKKRKIILIDNLKGNKIDKGISSIKINLKP